MTDKKITSENNYNHLPDFSEDYKFLDFENTIQDISEKINALKSSAIESTEVNEQILALRKERDAEAKKIYSRLSTWQTVQVARHPQRPHTLDFIDSIFDDFDEMHGDRQFGDDAAIIGGICYLETIPVMIIGHEKGRDTEEKVRRNFGMPQPEGYRKAKRLMQFAEQFALPVITFIDTAGAYPGVEGEERGQSEAIARNLAVMSELKTPIIIVVTGEGGSGGALAISVGDHISMLQCFLQSQIGTIQNVLIEKNSIGHASNFSKVKLKDDVRPSSIIPTRIVDINSEGLVGSVIN